MKLQVEALKTGIFPVNGDLLAFLFENIFRRVSAEQLEGRILAVTSKIVSLAEGRIIARSAINKTDLVKRESDIFLGEIGYGCFLTVKEGLLIPSAGIDESNADGEFYILYPQNPFASTLRIYEAVKKEFRLKNFGVILTDSHTTPLRAGVSGIALAHAGFRGVQSKVDELDLFGVPLKMTRINVADSLAAAAVYCMGEAAESCPLAVLGCEVEFVAEESESRAMEECRMDPKEDLYRPLLEKWL